MIEYLIESFMCFALLFWVYEIMSRSTSNYKINRYLLLFSVGFSVLVPLLHISTNRIVPQNFEQVHFILNALPTSNYIQNNTEFSFQEYQSESIGISHIIRGIFLSISLLLFYRYIRNLTRLLYKWRTAEKVIYKGKNLCLVSDKIPPFTFLHAIFVNKDTFKTKGIEAELLLHEFAHKQQLHSLDILLIELLEVFFWFNPFIHLFKNRIKNNHEYLADDFVLQYGIDSKKYMNLLLHYSFPNSLNRLSSGFNHHKLLKNRLLMLSKFQEKKASSYRFFLMLPTACLLFAITAFNSPDSFPSIQNSTIDNEITSENIGTLQADQFVWSAENKKVYISGERIVLHHGSNNFSGRGNFSYLGTVNYLLFNGKEVKLNTTIDIKGRSCKVIKLNEKEATAKYGTKGNQGAVEIWNKKN